MAVGALNIALDEANVLSKFDSLVQSGLVHYSPEQKIIERASGQFKIQFVLAPALSKKPTLQTSKTQPKDSLSSQAPGPLFRSGSDISTEGYEIGTVGSGHVLVAVKFCFARPHLMLLTSDGYRRQFEPLDTGDLSAAWTVIQAMTTDYVAFFNCGKDAGCSRLHKHVQLMPAPTRHALTAFLDTEDGVEPEVPFQWFFRRLETPTFESLTGTYKELLAKATTAWERLPRPSDVDPLPAGAACPHNMVLTRRWMVVIPRRRAAANHTAGANALGMIGVAAVATEEEIDRWTDFGLSEALEWVGVPKDTAQV